MSEKADVIVIGGGSTGCSIAWHLLQKGMKITMIDRAAPGSGTTSYSPAIIRQNYPDVRISRLALESIRVFENWHEAVGGNCGLVQCGFLTAFAEEDRSVQVCRAEKMRESGITVAVIDTDDIVQLQPDFNPDGVTGGLFEVRGGYCDTAATIESLRNGIQRRGGTIRRHCPVTRIRVDGGRVTGVDTVHGAVDAPVVVNAAGVWAAHIAKDAGMAIPLTVTRHSIALFGQPIATTLPPLFAYQERRVDRLYMRSMVGGVSMVGSLDAADSDFAEADEHSTLATDAKVAAYHARAARRFKRFTSARALGGWASVFDDTPDGNPLIGADPEVNGLYLAVGMNGHCFKLAPVIGRGIADLISSGHTSLELDVFAPRRFI